MFLGNVLVITMFDRFVESNLMIIFIVTIRQVILFDPCSVFLNLFESLRSHYFKLINFLVKCKGFFIFLQLLISVGIEPSSDGSEVDE